MRQERLRLQSNELLACQRRWFLREAQTATSKGERPRGKLALNGGGPAS